MNRQRTELFLALAGVFIFLLGGLLAWLTISLLGPNKLIMVMGLATFMLAGLGFAVSPFFQAYLASPKKMTEEINVIIATNPKHRLSEDNPGNMKELAQTINTFADRFQTIVDNQAAQVQQAKAGLEEEKNRLAVLVSELTAGVLVCNSEGRILLYNNRAKQLLGQLEDPTTSNGHGGFVGLGRSVFGLIDRQAIMHALDDLVYHPAEDNNHRATQFVVTANNGQLIKSRITLVVNQQQEMNGFILNLEDVTQQGESSRRRYRLIQSLIEGIRSSLANIRAAIETIELYPQMDADKLDQLRHIIHEETLILSSKVNETTTEHTADMDLGWRLEEILDTDLLWAIQHRFEKQLDLTVTTESPNDNIWLRVDGYSIVLTMMYVMGRLKEEFGIKEVQLCLKQVGKLAAFDLVWQNGAVDMGMLWSWQHEELDSNLGLIPLTIRDVAEGHGGEVWCQADKTTNTAFFRLLLPTTSQPNPPHLPQITTVSRPEYYDFDLFNQAEQSSELDPRLLTELIYTAFDTETTGLNPSQGDEIISISAVRIVNSRLLRQEVFDQLVDPQRMLSQASIEITSISPEMLVGQPTIDKVLPVFANFAEGTVLVAHNAAFDMRLLQLKEASTGIKFTNPVLDTLLLSAVVHPHHSDHSLEAIADRLGINVIGRHTSLGDALLTGEVFLKLIPVLAEKGITTLAQTRTAAQKTYLARLKY